MFNKPRYVWFCQGYSKILNFRIFYLFVLYLQLFVLSYQYGIIIFSFIDDSVNLRLEIDIDNDIDIDVDIDNRH